MPRLQPAGLLVLVSCAAQWQWQAAGPPSAAPWLQGLLLATLPLLPAYPGPQLTLLVTGVARLRAAAISELWVARVLYEVHSRVEGGGGAAGDLRLAADELLLLLGHVCMPAFAPGLAYACARDQAVAHGLARAAVAAAGAPGISRELALLGARFCAAVGYVQAGAQPALPDATEGV